MPVSTQPVRPAIRRKPHDAESVLAVAVAVFNVRGYDGTSMEDLSRAAGISKSSIYHHVTGKSELLATALNRALDALFAVLDEPFDGPPLGRLEHVLRRSVQVLAAELPYVTLLVRVRGNTPVEQQALARRREFDRRVAALVAGADLRPEVDPAMATRLVFGLVNSVTEWYRPERGADAGTVADAVVDLVLHGLQRRSGDVPA